ncbi:MAG: glutamate racemase [Bacteroidales bacterium]|jgi:glutamate racemase|nr:glutamate racemase [Bacteroidales bacterium]MDD4385018.1 glutamate racemase [Bacteroidales bacterium]MDY0196674.1 glutamate racemase [Tenuifilaceae bacterium]
MERNVIGIFDSGVGGLTVLKELLGLLPNSSYIYFADTLNCPYGPKGPSEIIRLSTAITDFLIKQGCSIIVVACNTATAAAIDYLRANYSVPFVGMEPAVKPAALASKTKSIGVLATKGTFEGRLYQETTSKYANNINICYQIGSGLVELVEQGKSDSCEAKKLLKKYISPMLKKDIDHLVLGCTHYPFFIPALTDILPKNITIVNPAPAVAKQTAKVLAEMQKPTDCNNGEESFVQFYSSGSTETLNTLVSKIEQDTGTLFRNKSFKGHILFL